MVLICINSMIALTGLVDSHMNEQIQCMKPTIVVIDSEDFGHCRRSRRANQTWTNLDKASNAHVI